MNISVLIQTTIRQELEKYNSQAKHEVSTVDEVLDAEAAADFLYLKKDTIYRLVQKEKIPHSKPGKKLYFLREDLIQWIKEARVSSKSEISKEVDALLTNTIGRKKMNLL